MEQEFLLSICLYKDLCLGLQVEYTKFMCLKICTIKNLCLRWLSNTVYIKRLIWGFTNSLNCKVSRITQQEHTPLLMIHESKSGYNNLRTNFREAIQVHAMPYYLGKSNLRPSYKTEKSWKLTKMYASFSKPGCYHDEKPRDIRKCHASFFKSHKKNTKKTL